MTQEMKKHLYDKLEYKKIEINWNKNPIDMKLFLSFLTVEVKRSTNHLGSDNGWTLLTNDELKLRIGGGGVNGVEYLDTLQYGKNLSNPYNNYVNPFYFFDILTEEGKLFFIDYYKEDIDKIIAALSSEIEYTEKALIKERSLLDSIKLEVSILRNQQQSVNKLS